MIQLALSITLFFNFSLLTLNCQKISLHKQAFETMSGEITPTDEMRRSRAAHRATALGDGKVLITGGFSSDRQSLAMTEIYDFQTGKFSESQRMNVSRAGHSATRLPDGRVLIAGGFNGQYLDSAEVFNPTTGEFLPIGKMTLARSEHTAVLLADGKVLLAGGVGTGWTFLAEAEIFDPVTNSFFKTGKMQSARESHTATRLRDGTILITGGHTGRRAAIEIYQSAEIYDPLTGRFSATSNLTIRRHKHDAVELADGRVLIIGGTDQRDADGIYQSAEIYHPPTKLFTHLGTLQRPRYKLNGTSLMLPDGRILIAGGAAQAEVFDPQTNSFETIAGDFESARLFSTATILPDGSVLITGGYDRRLAISAQAWVYKP